MYLSFTTESKQKIRMLFNDVAATERDRIRIGANVLSGHDGGTRDGQLCRAQLVVGGDDK